MSVQAAFIIKGAAGLAVLWAVVWGMMSLAGVFEATPEKIVAYVEERPFSEITDSEERRERIRKVAKMTNQLTYEDRRRFRELEEERERERREATQRESVKRGFFDELDKDEKLYFLDLTINTAFKQMMVAFNEMEPEKRRSIVDRARKDMEGDIDGGKSVDERRLEDIEKSDGEIYDKIAEEGMRSYYQDATAETKRDLAPLLEQMQRQMRRP